jgi:hypothetical protein
MWLHATRLGIVQPVLDVISRRTRLSDRIMQGLIAGSGASVLLLLAWVHLGLGALLFAPAATPPRMLAASGPYVVTLVADSGQFVTGDGNLVSLCVQDRAGHPVAGVTARVHADMTTMPMPVPDANAAAQGDGCYGARLMFTMAGPWRLTVTIVIPGRVAIPVAFDVAVRWQ